MYLFESTTWIYLCFQEVRLLEIWIQNEINRRDREAFNLKDIQ